MSNHYTNNNADPAANNNHNNRNGRWYDKQEIMQLFHASERTIARRRKDGTLEYVAFGRKLFYPEEGVNKIFRKRKE